MKTRPIIYSLLYISVTIIWGAGFLFVNSLVRIMPAFMLLFLRFSIGCAVIFAAKKIKKSPKMSGREIFHGIITGAVIFIAFALQTYGAKYTTPAKNGMLTGLYVIFVPIIALLINYRGGGKKALMDAVICTVGMAVLFDVFSGGFSAGVGDMLTVLGAIAFAVHFMMLDTYAPKYDTLNFSVIQLAAVAVLAAISSLFLETGQYAAIEFSPAFYQGILFLGVLSTGYAYLMQTFVQSKIDASTVSIISCLEAVFAVAFSVLLKYEAVTVNFIIGALLMLAAMLNAIKPEGKEDKNVVKI